MLRYNVNKINLARIFVTRSQKLNFYDCPENRWFFGIERSIKF